MNQSFQDFKPNKNKTGFSLKPRTSFIFIGVILLLILVPSVYAICGDGILEPANGEQCDDGGTANGDGCNSSCQTVACENVFSKRFGGNAIDTASSVLETAPGGGYIFGGTTFSYLDFPIAGTRWNGWIVQTDSRGETCNYSSSNGTCVDSAPPISFFAKTRGIDGLTNLGSIQKTPDGGYIFIGEYQPVGSGTDSNIWLLKTNSLGETCDFIAGKGNCSDPTGFSRNIGGMQRDTPLKVIPTSDGGYLITAETLSYHGAGESQNGWLIKTNALGETCDFSASNGNCSDSKGFAKTFEGSHYLSSVAELFTGPTPTGYIVTGAYHRTGYLDRWLVKTDLTGQTCPTYMTNNGNCDSGGLFARTFGGLKVSGFSTIQSTPDGGFITAGNLAYGDDSNIFLLKTNSNGETCGLPENGACKDAKGFIQMFGQDGFMFLGGNVFQTPDGNFLITGTKELSDVPHDANIVIIKTNPLGETCDPTLHQKCLSDKGFVGFSGTPGTNEWGNSARLTSDGGYIFIGYTFRGGGDILLVKFDAYGNAPEDCGPQVCGNGVKEGSEECDDGATIDGDGCSATCTTETLCLLSPPYAYDTGSRCFTQNYSAGISDYVTRKGGLQINNKDSAVCGLAGTGGDWAIQQDNPTIQGGYFLLDVPDTTLFPSYGIPAVGRYVLEFDAVLGDNPGQDEDFNVECGGKEYSFRELLPPGGTVGQSLSTTITCDVNSVANPTDYIAAFKATQLGSVHPTKFRLYSCSPISPAPVCMDGTVNAGETCDNGGLCRDDSTVCNSDVDCGTNFPCTPRSGDGCDSSCQLEVAPPVPSGDVLSVFLKISDADDGTNAEKTNFIDGETLKATVTVTNRSSAAVLDNATLTLKDPNGTILFGPSVQSFTLPNSNDFASLEYTFIWSGQPAGLYKIEASVPAQATETTPATTANNSMTVFVSLVPNSAVSVPETDFLLVLVLGICCVLIIGFSKEKK